MVSEINIFANVFMIKTIKENFKKFKTLKSGKNKNVNNVFTSMIMILNKAMMMMMIMITDV